MNLPGLRLYCPGRLIWFDNSDKDSTATGGRTTVPTRLQGEGVGGAPGRPRRRSEKKGGAAY